MTAGDVTVGAVLAETRAEHGLTIEQASAATRIRAEHLLALESDQPDRLAAPVYARGYVRTYATYLGLDPEPLVARVLAPTQDPGRALGVGMISGRPRVVLTGPAVAGIGLLLLAGAFTVYAWRQIESDQRLGAAPPSSRPAAAAVSSTPVPTPSPQQRPIVVGVRVTDAVWLNVIVDGKSQYTDSGKILPAGSQVYFTGVDVKITSGKAAATFITIDGRQIGALGSGVATREFTSQTSP
jgi:cytoskeleton protein RodZ